jgi:hypothetical protein
VRAPLPLLVLPGLLPLLLPACGADARNDALLLLQEVEAIDLDAPHEDRAERVERVRTLPVRAEAVRRARDACVEAHEAMLDAEDRHIEAAHLLTDLLQEHGSEDGIPRAERDRFEGLLAESEEAIAAARGRFPTCHRAMRDLRLRYGGGR